VPERQFDVMPAEMATTHVRSRFFFGLTVALIVIVFVGFAPTFYLDPWFDTATDDHPFPTYLVIHAALLTAWFAGLVVQSALITRGRVDVHRKLGVIAAGVAAGVVVMGVIATIEAIPHAPDVLVTANSWNLLVFAVLVAAAIWKRSRPQVHRRLMLIAAISIIGPAVSPQRMFGAYLQSLLVDVVQIPLPLVFWVVLIVPMIVNDLLTMRRVHAATAWGVGAKATATLATVTMVNSGAAAAYVGWLSDVFAPGSG
jgi:hypothetical protein